MIMVETKMFMKFIEMPKATIAPSIQTMPTASGASEISVSATWR